MKQLLEAGVHFDHQTRRWNPKMQPFIFMDRNGIHIIDLQQTVTRLNEAYKFVEQLAANGENILFVGTKKQAQEAICEEAKRCGMYYVNQRWLGGMLTNFQTIQSRIRYLRDLEARRDRGDFERLPTALFIVDTRKERTAVLEVRRLDIPIVALADTNCDPDEMDYPIPANDDAIRAVRLLCAKIADAVVEGRRELDARQKDSEPTDAEIAAGPEFDATPEQPVEIAYSTDADVATSNHVQAPVEAAEPELVAEE